MVYVNFKIKKAFFYSKLSFKNETLTDGNHTYFPINFPLVFPLNCLTAKAALVTTLYKFINDNDFLSEYGSVLHYCEYSIHSDNDKNTIPFEVMPGSKFDTLDCMECTCTMDGLSCCG